MQSNLKSEYVIDITIVLGTVISRIKWICGCHFALLFDANTCRRLKVLGKLTQRHQKYLLCCLLDVKFQECQRNKVFKMFSEAFWSPHLVLCPSICPCKINSGIETGVLHHILFLSSFPFYITNVHILIKYNQKKQFWYDSSFNLTKGDSFNNVFIRAHICSG